MALNSSYGSTPIDEDARDDLLPIHRDVVSMAELDSLEAGNITDGMLWTWDEMFETAELLDQFTLRRIHQKMFGNVWTWAGRIRLRETTIGIAPYLIQGTWKEALDDTAWPVLA